MARLMLGDFQDVKVIKPRDCKGSTCEDQRILSRTNDSKRAGATTSVFRHIPKVAQAQALVFQHLKSAEKTKKQCHASMHPQPVLCPPTRSQRLVEAQQSELPGNQSHTKSCGGGLFICAKNNPGSFFRSFDVLCYKQIRNAV